MSEQQEKVDDLWRKLPVAFFFSVIMDGTSFPFKEVSGLNMEIELETINEGGLNTHQHQLPKQIKHGNLVLKGAKLPKESTLVAWVKETFEAGFSKVIQPKLLTINLLNETGEPLYTWTCQNAFPVKWEVDPLDADKNSVLIETLEFSYTTIQRI
jgi:phage tail-like protein